MLLHCFTLFFLKKYIPLIELFAIFFACYFHTLICGCKKFQGRAQRKLPISIPWCRLLGGVEPLTMPHFHIWCLLGIPANNLKIISLKEWAPLMLIRMLNNTTCVTCVSNSHQLEEAFDIKAMHVTSNSIIFRNFDHWELKHMLNAIRLESFFWIFYLDA